MLPQNPFFRASLLCILLQASWAGPRLGAQEPAPNLAPAPTQPATPAGPTPSATQPPGGMQTPPGATVMYGAGTTAGENATNVSGPIAIVPLDSKTPGSAAEVTGALQVSQGRAIIAASGTITSGNTTTQVTLPHRGTLRICALTSVKLAADSSVPAGETPGLLMAMDHGAIEASFATGRNSDILLTPDFRILIGGPGAAEVRVRLGQRGDTCVDNAGVNAPYVLVSSVFEGGAYRVQPGQRVMFQHGSLHEVVDQEKEPCGCPPAAPAQPNEFPLAQSEGLAPLSTTPPSGTSVLGPQPETTGTLTYNAAEHAPPPVAAKPSAGVVKAAGEAQSTATAPTASKAKRKATFFRGIGRLFRRMFGAD